MLQTVITPLGTGAELTACASRLMQAWRLAWACGDRCCEVQIREELQEKQRLLEAEMQNMQRLKTTFGEIKSLLRKGTAVSAAAC